MFLGFHLFFLAKTTLCGSRDVITLTVFLCCQALAQDAGAHGQRASQALNFGRPLSLLPELFDVLWPFRSCGTTVKHCHK